MADVETQCAPSAAWAACVYLLPGHLTPRLIILASDWSMTPSARPLIGQCSDWFILLPTALIWLFVLHGMIGMGIQFNNGGR